MISTFPTRRPDWFRLRAWLAALFVECTTGLLLTAITFGFTANSVQAAPPPGQLLAAQCAQCHGTNGQAVSGFESIRGKSADEMFKTLVEMKYRPVESIMDRQARGYTDAQLRFIAEFLAKLPPVAEGESED